MGHGTDANFKVWPQHASPLHASPLHVLCLREGHHHHQSKHTDFILSSTASQLTTKSSQVHLQMPSRISSPSPVGTLIQPTITLAAPLTGVSLLWSPCQPAISGNPQVVPALLSHHPGDQVQHSEGLKLGGHRGRTKPSPADFGANTASHQALRTAGEPALLWRSQQPRQSTYYPKVLLGPHPGLPSPERGCMATFWGNSQVHPRDCLAQQSERPVKVSHPVWGYGSNSD